jgi:hypothetical protein
MCAAREVDFEKPKLDSLSCLFCRTCELELTVPFVERLEKWLVQGLRITLQKAARERFGEAVHNCPERATRPYLLGCLRQDSARFSPLQNIVPFSVYCTYQGRAACHLYIDQISEHFSLMRFLLPSILHAFALISVS